MSFFHWKAIVGIHDNAFMSYHAIQLYRVNECIERDNSSFIHLSQNENGKPQNNINMYTNSFRQYLRSHAELWYGIGQLICCARHVYHCHWEWKPI